MMTLTVWGINADKKTAGRVYKDKFRSRERPAVLRPNRVAADMMERRSVELSVVRALNCVWAWRELSARL